MANQGAKKRKEENIRHMQKLLRLIITSNAIYLAIRLGFFYSSFTWKHWAGLILTSLAYVIPYQQLATMAKPAYIDGGSCSTAASIGVICGGAMLNYQTMLLVHADLQQLRNGDWEKVIQESASRTNIKQVLLTEEPDGKVVADEISENATFLHCEGRHVERMKPFDPP